VASVVELDPALRFESLRAARRGLAEICKLHEASVAYFRAGNAPWFLLTADEKPEDVNVASVHHSSTSASCIASLYDIPINARLGDLNPLAVGFSKGALERPQRRWRSEGAAETYCRVRTLPIILERAPAALIKKHQKTITDLVRFAWADVRVQQPDQGIAEHPYKPPKPPSGLLAYPPNSFLTYWGLRTLRALRNPLFGPVIAEHQEKMEIAILWSEKMLGTQVALSTTRAPQFDPHQLAWAIATIVDFGEVEVLRRTETKRLIEAGLRAFFSAQQQAGNWARGEALFHYPESGNAYCYLFETLAEFVRPALDAKKGAAYLELLEPYAPNLIQAWQYADQTKEALADGVVGWCSGHHPHRTRAEGWATAAAFSYLQQLRCLVGLWTRKAAARDLGVVVPRWTRLPEATRVLTERGDTWPVGGWSLADRLAGLFLNPTEQAAESSDRLDPDAPLVKPDQARSAILFGPPGTSKTTVIEALAASIGWQYVVVQPSQFLADGLNSVAARADAIFDKLMELDRCVVLFDEIDELIRNRRERDSDPFGRFLTTTMLPKLARLWSQRRVIFFVNTNWITKADPAIRRNQRFDAVLFVAPPSFDRKLASISGFLTDAAKQAITVAAVREALASNEKDALGWLALLTYDHLQELIKRLQRVRANRCDLADVRNALAQMAVRLEAVDWHQWTEDAEQEGGGETPLHPFAAFKLLEQQESVDFAAVCVVRLRADGLTTYEPIDPGEPPPATYKLAGKIVKRGPLLRYGG